MSERLIRSEQSTPPEHTKALSERAARTFLETHRVERLRAGSWRPGQPLLYLIPDDVRLSAYTFPELSEERKPNVARLDNPTGIVVEHQDSSSTQPVYGIANEEGGQVDYYAIDAGTGTPILVRTTNSVHDKSNPYFASEDCLFEANDEIFPRSEQPNS